jgi:hypothetical protein
MQIKIILTPAQKKILEYGIEKSEIGAAKSSVGKLNYTLL